MAKPVYILCAESVSLDKGSNLISLFHVLEGYTISPPSKSVERVQTGDGLAPPGIPSISLDFFGVAVWARDETEPPGIEYEYVLEISAPWESATREIKSGTMSFNKPFYRFMARAVLGIPEMPSSSGIISLVSRIRPVGNDAEWQSQEYKIPIKVVPQES